MVSETAGKVIQCKAAVAWAVNQPLSIETVEVAVPKAGEIRIRMVATGVCHSDAFFLRGGAGDAFFPMILGHEGAGIVESIGEGVTSVAPGDHVIPLYTPQCYECAACKSPNINTCTKNKMLQFVGLMSDGTTRFTCQGKSVRHSMGCSTFSEYTIVNEVNICKINPAAPLEKVCLIGCGISTGYGAALNTAKVSPGSTVAVWGLGGVGLAAVMGAKKAGASRIFGIDINPEKAEIGKQFGVTDFLNPKDFDKPMEKVIQELTNGGVDFALECCGIISCMQSALQACNETGSVCTLVGLANLTERLPVSPFELMAGRTLKGTYFGGWKSRDSVPTLVDEYVAKKLKVDEFISHTLKLESINEAFDLMKQGKSIRTVITF